MGRLTGVHLGLVFEPYVHFLLAQGGTFTFRNLANDATQTEDLQMARRQSVPVDNEQLDAQPLTRLLPAY